MTIRLTHSRFPIHALAAAVLACFAFGMSALISQTVFERLPHLEDEMAYLYQARTYAGGHLVIQSPDPRRAYWQPFLVDQGGLRFGKYTPGWSLQLALGTLMGQEWVINAFLSALTVAVTYRLGREIFNPDVGVIAAALTAFSPMALLLSGTLMGHTAALFAATLFLYAYWRIERGRRTLAWGVVAGIALGLLVANRPITAIAIATPVILWSAIRLIRALAWSLAWNLRGGRDTDDADSADRETALSQMEHIPARQAVKRGFFATLTPLIALSAFTLVIASIVPINNYLAVGNPTRDLYTLVWNYDQVGFGTCCGRSGHTLEKGIRQARFDLSLTAADLFGWQIGSLTQADGTLKPDVQNHLINEGDYWEELGVSWVLLPFGLLVAYRRKAIFVLLWAIGAYGWVRFALDFQGGTQLQNPVFAWLWIGAALGWLYLPLLFWRDRLRVWTWILWSAAIGLVILQMTYWIGSQRYSTRYFFEGLTAIAIISALPLAWLARRLNAVAAYLRWWGRTVREQTMAFSTPDFAALACAVGLGLAFSFAPWFTAVDTDVRGISLVTGMATNQHIGWSLWLIPIAAALGIASSLWGLFDLPNRHTPRLVTCSAGLIALTYFGVFLLQLSQRETGAAETLKAGFWIALALSVGLVVQAFIPRPSARPVATGVVPSQPARAYRLVVYGGLALALGYSLYVYSTPRISALRGFNFISQAQVQAIEERRTGDEPVLVVVNGAGMRWRAMGALMAMTSPYLNSDIVAAWNYEGTNGAVKQQILDRFPDRQVIELEAQDNYWWFEGDEPPPEVVSLGG